MLVVILLRELCAGSLHAPHDSVGKLILPMRRGGGAHRRLLAPGLLVNPEDLGDLSSSRQKLMPFGAGRKEL